MRFPVGGLEPGSGIKQFWWGGRKPKALLSPNKVIKLWKCYHFFPQKSQSGVQVGRLVGQQVVGVVPAAAQVVLDHGFLHVHPLHFPPGAAARVQQAAQALRQRGQTFDAGHPSQRTVRGFSVHRPESCRANRGRTSHQK